MLVMNGMLEESLLMLVQDLNRLQRVLDDLRELVENRREISGALNDMEFDFTDDDILN